MAKKKINEITDAEFASLKRQVRVCDTMGQAQETLIMFWKNTRRKHVCILGDYPQFWVCPVKVGTKLEQCGYDRAF